MNITQAAAKGMVDLVEDLLLRASTQEISEALVAAAQAGQASCVRVLVKEPVVSRAQAIYHAYSNGYARCVALLRAA